MQDKQLLDDGKYVIISVEEEEVYDRNKDKQYIRREFETHHDKLDTSPFRAVLMVTPGAPINPHYSDFQDQVNNRSRLPPFNIPFHPHIKIHVPIYAGYAYDAVMVYANALTNVLANGGSQFDGLQIINAMKKKSYKSNLLLISIF
jgi:hypothetical protein